MHPLETYLKELRDIRLSGGGVKETSYYGPLATLLDEAGKGFRPKVRCIVNLRNTGAGIPDGGFFTQDQFPRASAEKTAEDQLPQRGALEVKGLEEDAFAIAEGDQVSRYLARYGQVLVTNLRDFVLVGTDATGERTVLESFRIAPSRDAFLEALQHPRRSASDQGEPLLEYLKRVLLRPAPLADPKDLAWFLASYAKEARTRIEGVELPALKTLRESLEASLGIRFEGRRGDHFFRSTLVQTLFYGVFSAWVLWNRQEGKGRFHWREAAWSLRVPMIRALFHQVADPERLQRLDLVEVLDWAAEALNRVERRAFFTRFREDHAVQYFYEPFLEAFDPQLRKELGVWYTPPEVVSYMVAKVDHVLRTELEVDDGLADPRVVVLDPACGTGAYLVEVLHRIEQTLRRKGEDALIASDIKAAAMQRIFGFDLLPAPFVVAHLQLGLLLQHMGVPFSEDERAGVYLTNALTGWLPPEDSKEPFQIALPELQEERDRAAHVKRDEPILVILGNPPYSGYAGVAIGEERELTEAYRTTKRAPKPQGHGLNDPYVRFFRMAERKITEMEPRRGVVCFISNYSWLDGLSFTGMRERYLEAFDKIWVDNLHGDRRISEYSPDGRTSETVFAMRGSSVGIKIGTAISTLVLRSVSSKKREAKLLYRDFEEARASERRAALLASQSVEDPDLGYQALSPEAEIGLPFKPKKISVQYLAWPTLPELFPESFPGVKTSRDEFLVDVDRERLEDRVHRYLDRGVSDEQMAREHPSVMARTARFDPQKVRAYLVGRHERLGRVIRYIYRPFDLRWLYWEPETKLLDEKRSDYVRQIFEGNRSLVAQQRPRREWSVPQHVESTICIDIMDRSASAFPLILAPDDRSKLFDEADPDDPRRIDGQGAYNLSDKAVEYLDRLGSVRLDVRNLFHHAIAVLHSRIYAGDNEGALRQDWPRIPLPETRGLLVASAELGGGLADLLNPEAQVPGVTKGDPRPELRVIGPVRKTEGGQIDPKAGDLALTAGWGYAGARAVTMPGRGRAEERSYSEDERAALAQGAPARDLAPEDVLGLLGETTFDIYLNEVAFWSCIPARVWEYTLGGYQVIKKWLSYREKDLLGRSLKVEEVREVTHIARRIAAILLLGPELDANYRRVSSAHGEGSPSAPGSAP